ncbi:MAG: Antibiotic biosynthesis monooxygenase [Frankiales bacterium]|nr:Antibiotic biosynthesis monooxygenase [Frankiales bacterium]
MTPARAGTFVTVSGIAVPVEGAADLERAMQDRIGLVDAEAGFRALQVWRPVRSGDPYRMVTWWDDEAAFRSYMRSPAHAASHARTPDGPHRPRPAGLDRYWCIGE